MGDVLDHSLINPNQLRSYGIDVQDNPFGDTAMHIASDEDDFAHPMTADGTTIFFDSRTPSNHELETCPHIILSHHPMNGTHATSSSLLVAWRRDTT